MYLDYTFTIPLIISWLYLGPLAQAKKKARTRAPPKKNAAWGGADCASAPPPLTDHEGQKQRTS
eukprot:7363755-Pyramimonas_sp.AAC.1